MVADFFTKPIQGNLFQEFRDIIMGYEHIYSIHKESPDNEDLSCQERVGKEKGYKTVSGNDGNPSLEYQEKSSMTWADVVRNNRVKG